MKNNIFSFLIGIFLGSILFVPIITTRLDATETKVKTGNEALQSYYGKHKNDNEDMTEISEEIYYDSLEYLACLVEAEAGNQDELGKRLVVDVVLNRVDSNEFPDNIYDVINQKNQFESVLNGKINEVSPSDDTYEIVRSEFEDRLNYDVLFFRAGKYHEFGKKLFKQQDHYFNTL